MAENKIKYGIKNVYYAIATIGTDGTATYGDPVALPGAVSLSMEAQGENTNFYADNIVYWVGNGNSGYSGDLELAEIPESFRENVLGEIASANKLLVEEMNAEAVHFALLFQFEGDQKATRHALYNCTATRPAVSGSTKNETIEPQTSTLSLTATSVYNAALQKDIVKASTKSDTTDTVYNGWFTAVTVPTATTT